MPRTPSACSFSPLVLIYMVMASLFESFAQPFTIMFSVPFAFIASVLMTLTGQAAPRARTWA